MDLGANTAANYFLVTAVNNGVESLTAAAQIAATAYPLEFETKAGGTDGGTLTGTVWMDKNLGASQVATAIDDAAAFGDWYQWGRAADGHQLRTNSTLTGTLSLTISPNHAEFITTSTGANDWLAAGVDANGAERTAIWSRIDGSSICPTGFRVPTMDELGAERDSWAPQNTAGAFASNLKWTSNGFRSSDGQRLGLGYYWSTTVDPADNSRSVRLAIDAAFASRDRAVGYSVRCIQN